MTELIPRCLVSGGMVGTDQGPRLEGINLSLQQRTGTCLGPVHVVGERLGMTGTKDDNNANNDNGEMPYTSKCCIFDIGKSVVPVE